MPLSDILTFAIALVLIVSTCRELSTDTRGSYAFSSFQA